MRNAVTLKKFTDDIPNEDSFHCGKNFIAISDGAGGCGLFARQWSRYLVEHIPEEPIKSYECFDKWVDSIWEPFYKKYEKEAKEHDGIFLSKFYSEGACATIAVVWKTEENKYEWISYGDSVIFHYNKKTQKLEHSFTCLKDFMNPPFLISCKDPLSKDGFRQGTFETDDRSVVFACSDTLAHFVLMMFMATNYTDYKKELDDIINLKNHNSSYVAVAKALYEKNIDRIISLLETAVESDVEFENIVKKWYSMGLIDVDDYTLAFIKKYNC